MVAGMQLYGQTFTTPLIERIGKAIAGEPELTRSALSRRVCAWLDWHDAQGRACEVSCRKALVELERRGLVTLPAPRRQAPQYGETALEPFPQGAFAGTLAELGAVELVAVNGDRDLSLVYRRMLASHHPLGPGRPCGAQRRYLIHSPRAGWLGALAFSAAAWQLAVRDRWIGWSAQCRRAHLGRLVANSRFLLLPGIEVPNLGSHVLGLAAQRVVSDWQAHYGVKPVLLETFVDEARHAGTVYRAANWQRLGRTAGRGRQDRHGRGEAGAKAVYVLPLQRNWRSVLCRAPVQALRLPPEGDAEASWVENEFGRVRFADGRLRSRLLKLAGAFFDQPLAPIPQALHGDAGQTKAAYRFFHNPQVDLQSLLQPHYEATAARIGAHPVVLVPQDTTSLNYDAHAATQDLGPINTVNGPVGLKLHDSLALTPEGIPLGLVDIRVWARDARETGKARRRKERPIEDKESARWLHGLRRLAELQRLCPQTRLVSVADREADIYELFQEAAGGRKGPDLLVRASRTTQRRVNDEEAITPLWEHLPRQPLQGTCELSIPGRGGRKRRITTLEVRCAPIQLRPPKRLLGAPALSLWAVHAVEPEPPEGHPAVEWMLITTVPTPDLETALERLRWYTARWNIEVFHRTLKSGCRIEDRRLGDAHSLQACLAIDLVVAWRVMYLTKLGRETPELPCSVFFEEAEWQALYCHHHRCPEPPQTPPSLGEAMRWVAKLGGFLGRKSDGHPGAATLWRGLCRLSDITATFTIFHPSIPNGP